MGNNNLNHFKFFIGKRVNIHTGDGVIVNVAVFRVNGEEKELIYRSGKKVL